MNMPQTEFLCGIQPSELPPQWVNQKYAAVFLAPLPKRLHTQMGVYTAQGHGTDVPIVTILSDSELVLQGRLELHFFAGVKEYSQWLQGSSRKLQELLLYPACYNLRGQLMVGSVFVALYG